MNRFASSQPPSTVYVSAARLSLDLLPTASGGTYRDTNIPAGVKIDGWPDAVPAGPIPAWRELVFGGGRVAFISTAATTDPSLRLYYKDDAKPIQDDTGDQMSYADSGLSSGEPDGLRRSPMPWLVFLDPAATVTAARLAEEVRSPLAAITRTEGAVATPTAAATPTAVASPSPTALDILPRVVVGGTVHFAIPYAADQGPTARVSVTAAHRYPPGQCDPPVDVGPGGTFRIVCANVYALAPITLRAEAPGFRPFEERYDPITCGCDRLTIVLLGSGGGSLYLPWARCPPSAHATDAAHRRPGAPGHR